jgi:signal transduction histidine kinase
MASGPKRPILPLALVAGLAAVLVLLAVLQYRWSLAVSRAEEARIKASLNTSIGQFRREFYRELLQVCTIFHRDPVAEGARFWTSYVDRYQAWLRASARPDLIANVYVWASGEGSGAQLLVLKPDEDVFVPVEWPAALTSLRTRLEGQLNQHSGTLPPEMRLFPWTMEGDVPALVHRISKTEDPLEMPRVLGFIILELNATVFQQQVADMSQRIFAGAEGFGYDVAIVNAGTPFEIVYRSNAHLTQAALTPPDAWSPLLTVPGPENRGPANPTRPRIGPGALMLLARNAVILASRPEAMQIWVRHRGGGLESVVAADRRRSLLLSFGVLLLLAVSMALIMLSAQRARRLAELQMQFVAGISHELRTPVTVMCAAADNLAEGFVGSREQVKEYGALIRNEGRRLAGMIEQILHFAASQAGRAIYDLRAVEVPSIVSAALDHVAALPEARGFTLERAIEADLPFVHADPAALTRCLQNLVVNAVKYGGSNRWAIVRAQKTGRNGTGGVRISVEDKGMGIEAADLPHIFEPFYRGKAAQAAQIRGTGLGLNLAREIAQRMGGSLTVASQVGRGSTFTLELLAEPETPQSPGVLPRTA